MKKLFLVFIYLTIFLFLNGCAAIYNPATEQKEFYFVTTPVEVSIGNILNSKLITQFKFSEDKAQNDRLKKIGEKLAKVSDRKDISYKFFVIEDDSLNAFTTPGGYIYVHTGIMEKANDDELSCVIAHEVAHVAARHIAKKLQAQIGYDILMTIAARESNIAELQKAASLSYDIVMNGYSRNDELLADKVGVKYAYKAGYDPYSMITFLEKLKNEEKETLGFLFLRSHPYISDRIKALKKEIPKLVNKIAKNPERKEVVKKDNTSIKRINTKPPKRVMCPKCKKIFSGTLNYCPYDGTKLK